MLLNTESPKPDKCIELSTIVRQAVTFSISIKNPLNQPITFEVIINGDGLIGKQSNWFINKQLYLFFSGENSLYVGAN